MKEKRDNSMYKEDISNKYGIINFVKPFIRNFRFRYISTAQKSRYEIFYLLFVTVLAFFTHNYNIENPKGIVFDEVYFGNFTQLYLTREYFFDIHPPTAKLLLALVGLLTNITRYNYNYELGAAYVNDDYIYLRTFCAYCGALKVPILYFALRFSGITPLWAVCTSFMCIVDNGLIVESRHVLTDGILHLFTSISILGCAIVANVSSMRYFGVIIACIGVSLAVSCKFTAGGLIVACFFSCIFRYNSAFICKAGSLLLISVFSTMIISFYIHLKLLINPGYGCIYHEDNFCDDLETGKFTVKLVALLQNIHFYNVNINRSHSYQSYPHEWPLMTGRSLLMYTDPKDYRKQVWCVGTPSVWYVSFLSLLFFAFRITKNTPMFVRNSYLLFGYLASYLPFFLVGRPMWNYHYHIPLIHTILMTAFTGEYFFGNRAIYPIGITIVHIISFIILWHKTYHKVPLLFIAKINWYFRKLFA